jgi:hypothetical protein
MVDLGDRWITDSLIDVLHRVSRPPAAFPRRRGPNLVWPFLARPALRPVLRPPPR